MPDGTSGPLKETPFTPFHRELGARLVEFAGYLMPVSYAGINAEHRAVRTAVGLFDVSHMGEFIITGREAAAFVQKITTNDVNKLGAGGVQYSAMCRPDGGIIDDLLVYHLGESLMLVVNAANMEKDLAWIRSASGDHDVGIRDASPETSLLAVQGPRAPETLGKITGADPAGMRYYTSMRTTIAGVEVLLSRTGYTGEVGYELYFDASRESADTVWRAVMSAGAGFGIQPAGLGARDTLRLEMGFCLYGNDIDETTNPLEAGLGWITKLDKGDFIGKNALVGIKQSGPARKLTGFVTGEPRAIPRRHYPITAGAGPVGEVTSGTMSPTLGRGIGLGYLPADLSAPGKQISVMIRDRAVPATTTRLPFVQSHP